MHKNMTDQELKEAMKQMAKIAGLDLSQERIDQDLGSFKRHLEASMPSMRWSLNWRMNRFPPSG